jgi:hypothetical protein
LFVVLFFLFDSFQVWWFQYSFLNNVESPLRYVAWFLNLSFDAISVICRLHNIWSPFKIPFYLGPPIVFSFRAHVKVYLGTIGRFSWNGTKVSHWRLHDNRRITTHLRMFLNSNFAITMIKCWSLLKPVLGVDGNLHFPVPSIKRLYQTEPETFQFCLVGLSLGIRYFPILTKRPYKYWRLMKQTLCT